MIKRHFCWWGCVFLLLLSACNMPKGSAIVAQVASDNQTWFDAPLDGSVLPLAPYEVVLHAYAGSGVSQVELKANTTILATLPNPGSEGKLATFKYQWNPLTPGNITLIARAQDKNGTWGSVATVHVTINDSLTPATITPTPVTDTTITPTPITDKKITPTIPTPTPVITSTVPTLVPTISPTVTKVPGLTFSRQVSSSAFYYGDCSPNRITVQAQVSNPAIVTSIVLFQKLDGEAWDAGTSMSPLGGGNFTLTISARSVPGAANYESAIWTNQLVATDATGAVIGRSQNFSDVTFYRCEAPVQVVDTPTYVAPYLNITPYRFVPKTPTAILR